MLLIPCPWCGPRDEAEFHYGGQAHVPYPEDPAALTDEEWARYLFFRDNPKGPFAERWTHAAGCRRWFNAVRDTATNEVLAVYRSARHARHRLSRGGLSQPVRHLRTRPLQGRRGPRGRSPFRRGRGGAAGAPHPPAAPPRVSPSATAPAAEWTATPSPSPSTAPSTRATEATPSPPPCSPTASSRPAPASSSVAPAASSRPASRNPTRSSRSRPPSPSRCCPRRPSSCTTAWSRAACPARAGSPTEPDPARYDAVHAHCDLLVVGAGPAGLAAAAAAARSGARVILADDQPEPGGSLLGTAEHLDLGGGGHRTARCRRRGARPAPHHRLRLLRRQLPPGRRAPHQPPRRRRPRGRLPRAGLADPGPSRRPRHRRPRALARLRGQRPPRSDAGRLGPHLRPPPRRPARPPRGGPHHQRQRLRGSAATCRAPAWPSRRSSTPAPSRGSGRSAPGRPASRCCPGMPSPARTATRVSRP